MKINKIIIALLFFMSAIITLPSTNVFAADGTGSIQGEIHVKSKRYKKNSVVYIENVTGEFPLPEKHAVMDQIELVFLPQVLTILKGATVDFLNSDDVAHNVMSPDDVADKMNLGTWLKGEVRSYTFNNLGPAVMLCNVHPEMEAYVVILQNPYYAISDEQGKFTIENVPVGEYTLKVWNKKYRSKKDENIHVESGKTLTVDFKLKR